jgi:tetratricopeptide (TPR) repeat protein
VALGCALAGFALHSMIELSPWMPAPALVFWSAAGAMLAQSGPGRSRNLSTGRRVWPVLAWAGVAAAVVLLWWPVARKVALSTEAARQVGTADIDAACRLAEAAAEADPLDSQAAAEASRLHLTACPRGIDAKRQADAVSRRLDLAARWAGEAVRRDPADFSNYRLAGQVLWLQADPGAIKYAASIPDGNRADIRDRLLADLKKDPNNEVLMLLLARIAAAQGDRAEAVRRCEQALRQDPNCPLLLGELGDAAWRAGMEPKAVAAWRRALGLAPRGLTADRAVELYAKAVELNPQDMRLRLSFAQMLCRAGRTTESLAQLEAVKGIDRLLLPASVERLTLAEDEAVTLLNTRLTVLVPVKTPGKLTSDRDQQPVEEARPP